MFHILKEKVKEKVKDKIRKKPLSFKFRTNTKLSSVIERIGLYLAHTVHLN